MDSHESNSSCLVEKTTTFLYDPIVTARRKRRDIRLFKKLGNTSPASILLKRAGARNSVYLLDGGGNDEGDGSRLPDLLSKMSDKQRFSELVECRLARSSSYPPEGRQPSRFILQIKKVGSPSSENGARRRDTAVKDDALASKTPSAASATDFILASSLRNPHLARANVPLQRACTDIDEANIPHLMAAEDHHRARDADVTMPDEQNQAASNMTPQAVTDGLFLAGKTALLHNVEGSLPIALSQTRLEVIPVSSRDYPPSAKVLICGRRREMEDTAVIAPSFSQIPPVAISNTRKDGQQLVDLHFHGVYDGHGGSQASKYCEERLHHALAEEIASYSMTEDSSNRQEWQRVMSSCFLKVDKEVGGVCPYGVCDTVDSNASCCAGTIAPENAGTTAVVAVISSSQLIVANCGDSRAVLSRGGKAFPLSQDHKPDKPDETSRIEAAGGRVIAWEGYRVEAFLALSRAIGDRYLKRYVISEPDVACLDRTDEDECVILASDGLWDVIDNATACDVARRCLASSRDSHGGRVTSHGDDYASATAAATLVKLACGKGSQDNITVLVIDLHKRKK